MHQLLVYGSSIFLAGVSAQLATQPDLQLSGRQTLAELGNLYAYDAVLVDLNDPTSTDVLRLLRARPDLRVIGLNAATGALTVLAGQVYFTPTFTEIVTRLNGMLGEGVKHIG